MTPAYIIESEQTLRLLKISFPHGLPDGGQLIEFSELAWRLAEASPLGESRRRELVSACVPVECSWSPEAVLKTLEALRLSLLFSHEDVEFAFSALSTSPKNQELKRLACDYLASDLAVDLAAAAWKAIERLKGGELRLGLGEQLHFVGSQETSATFREFAQAAKYASDVQSAEMVSLETLRWGQGIHLGRIVSGDPESGVDRLVQRVQRLLSQGLPPQQIWLSFEGSPSVRWLLESRLDQARIPVRSYLPERATLEPSRLAAIVTRVRRNTSLSLADRLVIASRVLGHRLSPEELAPLQATHTPTPDALCVSPVENAVVLAPFLALPLEKGRQWLGFYEPPLIADPMDDWLLLPAERERLHNAGFPLPRPRLEAERRQRVIEDLGRAAPFRRWMVLAARADTIARTRLARRTRSRPKPAVNERMLVADRPLSATHLETYVRCPAQYYYSTQLRIRTKSRAEDRAAVLFGQGVHRVLEKFFQEPDSSLRLRDPKSFGADFEGRFLKEMLVLAPELAWDRVTRTSLLQRARALAPEIPRLERDLVQIVGPTTPIAFERVFEMDWHGLKIKGTIDRIDRLESGELLILDYKTGEVDFSPNQISRGEHFQTLLYLLATQKLFEARPLGLLFYDLKRGELRRGLMNADSLSDLGRKKLTRGHCLSAEKLDLLLDQGARAVETIASAIKSGEFVSRPGPKVCRHCEFASLCREAYRHE